MKIEMFIVVDDDGKIYNENGKYQFSNIGDLIYPIGSILPIIRKGKGAIGLGLVTGYASSGRTTTVHFTAMGKISAEEKAAFYNLYRINNGMNASNGDYDDTDQFIPGALGLGKKVKPKPASTPKRSRYDVDDEIDDYFNS